MENIVKLNELSEKVGVDMETERLLRCFYSYLREVLALRSAKWFKFITNICVLHLVWRF